MELYIESGGRVYEPVVEGSVTLGLERGGAPGTLRFSVVKDEFISFTEGNTVLLRAGEENLFRGFVFKKARDKRGLISVTAYDQLRYLKNKDTIVYGDMTASALIRTIAGDYKLSCGEIQDTGVILESRVEDNRALTDIIQSALEDTRAAAGRLYVLYDDYGKLTLKNAAAMKLDLLIDAESGENFSYESSIDERTYNTVKLMYEDGRKGRREIFTVRDEDKIKEWGMLQYFEKLKDTQGANAKADTLLELYGGKTRKLYVSNAFGDTRVRAGSSVAVRLNLGDVITDSWMLADSVTHTFKGGEHFMDLLLTGGEFIG